MKASSNSFQKSRLISIPGWVYGFRVSALIPANVIIKSAFMLILYLLFLKLALVENSHNNLWGMSESFDYFCGGGKDRKTVILPIVLYSDS